MDIIGKVRNISASPRGFRYSSVSPRGFHCSSVSPRGLHCFFIAIFMIYFSFLYGQGTELKYEVLIDKNGDNTAIGVNAMTEVTGNDNSGVGADVLTNAGAASSGNSVIGSAILNNTGNLPVFNNSLVGVNAMTNGRGNSNCGIGFEVMKNAVNANNNVAIGSESMINITTGGNNIAIGHQSARTLTEALQCIIIGPNAEPVSPTAYNQLNIGSTIWGTDINNGGTDAKIGISTNTPEQRLHVNGKIKVGDDTNTPTLGTIRYNSTIDKFQGYTTTGWVDLN